MAHSDFTLDDLDQSVLDALARRKLRREAPAELEAGTAAPTLDERLKQVFRQRMGGVESKPGRTPKR